MPNQLNVVFHGTFAFVNWGTSVEVLVPHVMDHVYKAGTWEKEVDVDPDTTYNLVGVAAETAVPPLQDLGIAVVNGKRKIRRDEDLIAFTVMLPPPFQFAAKRCFKRSDGKSVFVGDDGTAGTKNSKTYATTHIMSYHCTDPEELRLLGLDWTPEPDDDGNINLHIFAEPDDAEMVEEGHVRNSFHETMHLFHAKLRLRGQKNATFEECACPTAVVVDGLPAEQEQSLIERKALFGEGTDPANCAAGGSDNGTDH
jgi:hypothetical protein